MYKKVNLIWITLIFVQVSFSQTGETELSKELQKAVQKLDSVYEKLKNGLLKHDKELLEISQNDWLKFKVSNCNFKSLKETEGGVISNKIYIDCQIQATELRIKELSELLDKGF